MFILKHVLLAVATAFNPSLYRTQCSALLAGNLPAYAATLAPSYRVLDLGGKVETRGQVLRTFTRWFRAKSGTIESCRANAATASSTATSAILPLHIVENVAIRVPYEGVRRYRIDLHAIERWEIVAGRWQAVESVVQKRSVTPL